MGPHSHLLDTTVYSQPLRRAPAATALERWKRIGDSRLATSIFCETEVLQGLERAGSERLWEMYRLVLENRLALLPFDKRVAQTYARLQAHATRAGSPRPVFDLLIAATALENDLILATLNARHFNGIPGLEVEHWAD